jgi:hypothetical protein
MVIHTVQLSCKVTAAFDNPRHRGMKAVIVARGEVNDTIVKSSRRLDWCRSPPWTLRLAQCEISAYLGLGGCVSLGGLVSGHLCRLSALWPRPRKQVWKGVRYAVYLSKLFVGAHYVFLGVLLMSLWSDDLRVCDIMLGLGRTHWTQESIETVRDTLDLLDFAMLDGSELDDLAVGRGQDSVGVGIEWSDTWLECAVEECSKIGVDMEIGLRYFRKTGSC